MLNDILHDEINDEVDRLIALPDEKPVFLSAPLFFEARYEQKCREVWVITAPEETRASRAGERDGVPVEDVRARMLAQTPDETLIAKADVVIDNCRTKAELISKVDKLLEGLVYEN